MNNANASSPRIVGTSSRWSTIPRLALGLEGSERHAKATKWSTEDFQGHPGIVGLDCQRHGLGYSRIVGELRNLGVCKNSRQSVNNILVEHGIDPDPQCGKRSWSEFFTIHAKTLWQVDFFGKRVWTLQGPRQTFSMVFQHGASRRVFVTLAKYKPDATWTKSQAAAFLSHAKDEQLSCSIVMRDLDRKYSSDFDRMFTKRSIQVKPVGRERQI